MTIREALQTISLIQSEGNKPGSDPQSTSFTNLVIDILKNVGEIQDHPNGRNNFPSFRLNGIDFMVKTSRGIKPMWNESYVRTESILILLLKNDVIVCHGSLITDFETEALMSNVKKDVVECIKEKYGYVNNFRIIGGRVQFGDTINWLENKEFFLEQTLKIMEERYD